MDWNPAVLDVAARAAMGDVQETAALTALLRRRWPPPGPEGAHAPRPARLDVEIDGGNSGSDPDEGGGTQSLLELTAAVYRRGGATGPGAASRLPALVALFVTLQQPMVLGEEGEQPRFLGANDAVAFLQVSAS